MQRPHANVEDQPDKSDLQPSCPSLGCRRVALSSYTRIANHSSAATEILKYQENVYCVPSSVLVCAQLLGRAVSVAFLADDLAACGPKPIWANHVDVLYLPTILSSRHCKGRADSWSSNVGGHMCECDGADRNCAALRPTLLKRHLHLMSDA